ncbi:MAG TPA: hypothetical protein VHM25_12205 [Polyangiaceae bacterium]|jgi:hypothetical protein|nr:hypothetical protein [Polyangiaceae bacterium]
MIDVTRDGSSVERYADDFYSGCPWGPLVSRTIVTELYDIDSVVARSPNPSDAARLASLRRRHSGSQRRTRLQRLLG